MEWATLERRCALKVLYFEHLPDDLAFMDPETGEACTLLPECVKVHKEPAQHLVVVGWVDNSYFEVTFETRSMFYVPQYLNPPAETILALIKSPQYTMRVTL